MYKLFNLFLCLIWILNLGCINALHRHERDLNYTAPLITPKKDSIILQVGDNFVLRCESSEPIVWWYDHNVPTIRDVFNGKPESPFGIAIKLVNVNVYNVGAYFCIKANQQPHNRLQGTLIELLPTNEATSIYVYVNDAENLLAPVNHIVTTKLNTSVLVPCKPTMPNTEVLLYDDAKLNVKGEYYPKRGYIVKINSLCNIRDYYCKPKKPSPENQKESAIISVRFIGSKFIHSANSRLYKPVIRTKFGKYVYKGETIELDCVLTAPSDLVYQMKWKYPIYINKSYVIIQNLNFHSNLRNQNQRVGRSRLTVVNATDYFEPSHEFECIVSDINNNSDHIKYVVDVKTANSTTYLNFWLPLNRHKFEVYANETITITSKYNAFPRPKLRWFKPNGIEVKDFESKFTITTVTEKTTLTIRNVQLVDNGIYILNGTNGINKQLEFNVSVISQPEVVLNDVYAKAGSEINVTCTVKSNPTAEVTFHFRPCVLKRIDCESIYPIICSKTLVRPGKMSAEFVHECIFTSKKPGVLISIATNQIKNTTWNRRTVSYLYLGEISQNISIFGFDKNRKIAKGDHESFTCAALAYYLRSDLEWFLNGKKIDESLGFKIETNNTEYTFKKTLVISAIDDSHSGTYECRAKHSLNSKYFDSVKFYVYVNDPETPQWDGNYLDAKTKIERNLGESLDLECKSKALPRATVRWYKDDVELNETNRTEILENGTRLFIKHLFPENEGVYRCVVENRLGSISKRVTVIIPDLPHINKLWIWLGSIFIVGLAVLCVFLAIRFLKDRKRLMAFKAAGLANFEQGDIDQINPTLTLDEQSEYLPYDRGFEFPRDKLKLGNQLDAGAFGVVHMGEAQGIRSNEPVTTVAVKMVQRTTDVEMVKALVSELKIMVHLGQHLNVVNLLGAVTKNIVKRELMIIFEYCRFGNIQNFLMRNRKYFINQINPVNDKIDASIKSQHIYKNFELNRDNTEAITVTTTDLISWAFQVARGMDYLSSKRILHGDLAARNVLLCEDNVVKICDFGLARSMYKDDSYTKLCMCGKLPIKWLAPESLSDKVFSTYTDVWSFGIMLWELFSLAQVPYPGIQPNQNFFNKLNDGYRMKKPSFANKDLYEIMLDCWSKIPNNRPLFSVMERRLSNLLEDDIVSHYVNLNEPYLRYMRIQAEYMKYRPADNLSTIRSLNEFAPDLPRYINADIFSNTQEMKVIDGYLKMEPKKITDFENLSLNTEAIETSFLLPENRESLTNDKNKSAHRPLQMESKKTTMDTTDQTVQKASVLDETILSEGKHDQGL